MKKETKFQLLFPCLTMSLDIKAELSVVKEEDQLKSFDVVFAGSYKNEAIGKLEIKATRDDENKNGGTMEFFQTASIPSYILESDKSASEFLKSTNGVEVSCCDLLTDAMPLFYSNILAALVYLPDVERDLLTSFQLMQKLGACIAVGFGYVTSMRTSLEAVESDFDGVVNVLIENFEKENKSILRI